MQVRLTSGFVTSLVRTPGIYLSELARLDDYYRFATYSRSTPPPLD